LICDIIRNIIFVNMKKNQSGNFCPLIRKDCIEHKCSWYMHVRGMDPNTGTDVDHWSCAVTWMPMLTIENSQQQRQTGAAVESFRNEMVKANEASQELLLATASISKIRKSIFVDTADNQDLLK
jgi:hypothetical protein